MEAWQWILNLSVCVEVDVLIKSTSLLFIADIYELSFCRAVIAACDSDTAAAAAAILYQVLSERCNKYSLCDHLSKPTHSAILSYAGCFLTEYNVQNQI